MKKVLIILSVLVFSSGAKAQGQLTGEQARVICAQQMALFTKAVSGVFQKGISYDQFQFSLCGKLQPTVEGSNQLKAAYNFLSNGASPDFITRTYDGKEVAASLNYFYNLHSKGIDSDGSELFGGKSGSANTAFARNAEGGCRWYQFWCMVQSVATWLVMNWPGVKQLVQAMNYPMVSP